MIHAYTAKDAEEASLLVLQLRANGVAAVSSETAGAVAFGELPADVLRVKVWVPEDRVDAARQRIEACFEHGGGAHDASGAPWTCPSCGEENEATFEVCWSCQAVAPGV